MKLLSLSHRIALLSLVLASLLVLGGCYQDPIKSKLIGTWRIEHGDKLTRRVNQDADANAEDINERMTLTFYSSGALQTKTKMGDLNREKNGSWELVEFDEPNSVMQIRCELMDQKTEHKITFLEDDLIKLVPPNMAGTTSKLTFRRK